MWRRCWLICFAIFGCAVVACADPTEPWPDGEPTSLSGVAQVPAVRGNVWALLYRKAEGPPGAPAVPLAGTAVSDVYRQEHGEARYLFAQLQPRSVRLWGFLDGNQNFDPAIDVLAQPGAGDWVGSGVELELQPHRRLEQPLIIEQAVRYEPPAFRLETSETDLALDPTTAGPVTLTLLADDAGGRLSALGAGFHLGLVDVDGDGRPDDVNADGVPDLTLQLFLRFLPRPGQELMGADTIVPLVFNPAPFLAVLAGRLDTEVVAQSLQVAVIPTAQQVAIGVGGIAQLVPVGAAPAGDYELVALAPTGQFWRMPNQLGAQLPSQAVRFHFVGSGR